jgi:hypothetical protein
MISFIHLMAKIRRTHRTPLWASIVHANAHSRPDDPSMSWGKKMLLNTKWCSNSIKEYPGSTADSKWLSFLGPGAETTNRTSCSEPVCMSLKMLIHTISSITDGLLLSNTNWTKWLPSLWIFARRIFRQFNLEGSAQRRSLTARAVLPMCDHSESAKALYERISTLKYNWIGNAAEQEHYLHQQHRPRIAYEKPRWWKMIELLLSG